MFARWQVKMRLIVIAAVLAALSGGAFPKGMLLTPKGRTANMRTWVYSWKFPMIHKHQAFTNYTLSL